MEGKYPATILVVEDNADHAVLIQGVLSQWAKKVGSKIVLTSSVAEALGKLSSSSYDLILTDYRLPGQTGLDLLGEIKNRKLKIPVVLMTSVGDEQLAVDALKSGFIDYVVKSDGAFQKLPETIEAAYRRFLMGEREEKLKAELAQKNVQLNSVNQKLAELSIRDELTQLYNHRFLQEKMTEEFARSTRYHYPLSCLMVDIDHFKAINDMHGHPTGDQVLKSLGEFFTAHLRQTDIAARYGGEEFVILLPHIDYEGAGLLAERLRKKIMDLSFNAPTGLSFRISASIGVASYPEDPCDQKATLLFYADKALYRAKGGGRNRVYLYKNMSREYAATKLPEIKITNDKVREFRQRLMDVSEMAKRAYIEATKALVNALEAKDPHTMGHATRVAHYSALVAREMGLREDEVRVIEHAGLLHDVGKICIADEVLLKRDVFTHEEYEKMMEHPLLGFQIIKPIRFLAEEALIILHHHEWYNGQGYPHKLKGKEIPAGARVVSVLDAYDTMRVAASRYRRTLSCEEAVREIIECSGSQFDPEVVSHFIQVLLKNGDLKPDAYDRAKLEQSLKRRAA